MYIIFKFYKKDNDTKIWRGFFFIKSYIYKLLIINFFYIIYNISFLNVFLSNDKKLLFLIHSKFKIIQINIFKSIKMI